MAEKHGVEKIKRVLTLVKLASISVLQQVAKDGFQPSDLIAPLSSSEFQSRVVTAAEDLRGALVEATDISLTEAMGLGTYAYGVWKDVKTEIDLAVVKLKK